MLLDNKEFDINLVKFQVDEGRIYGARYHTVAPIFAVATRTGFHQQWKHLEQWCIDTYGPLPDHGVFAPGARWYINNSKFWFRNESDATMFILKWA